MRVFGKRPTRSTPTRVGKTSERKSHHDRTRSTPTRVGKTYRSTPIVNLQQVHPHACGENKCHRRCLSAAKGPPPRVWGKRSVRSKPTSINPVHPHACGENKPCFTIAITLKRSTPTRVGKTRVTGVTSSTIAVHPHACGENDHSEEVQK